jgi:predicted DNA-binding protein
MPTISVRLSESEKQRIDAAAKAAGMTKSRWIKNVIWWDDPEVYKPPLEDRIQRLEDWREKLENQSSY